MIVLHSPPWDAINGIETRIPRNSSPFESIVLPHKNRSLGRNDDLSPRAVVTEGFVKRKAVVTCTLCHAQNFRCDVLETSSSCSRCIFHRLECVLSLPQTKRSKIRGLSGEPHSISEGFNSPSGLGQPKPSELLSSRLGVNSHDIENKSHAETGVKACTGDDYKTNTDKSAEVVKYFYPRESHVKNNPLPKYICNPPKHLANVDMSYLGVKDALTVPGISLRNEILKAYAQFVHPYLPILDLERFLNTISQSNGDCRVSLLLFQAVLAAGVAFVDVEHLRRAGYPTKRKARRAFFRRIQLLYDFDFEIDRVTIIQSLLLMTYWQSSLNSLKDPWYWLGVGFSLARTIGLHRQHKNSRMDHRQQSLWKRIWWSMYTRDRLIALGMRRPMHIRNNDYEVEALALEDFERIPLLPEALELFGDVDFLRKKTYQLQLAHLFMEKVKLCTCISDILLSQYSVQSYDFGGTREVTMMLAPRPTKSNDFIVRTLEKNLEDWLSNLPVTIQYSQPDPPIISAAEKVLHLHRAVLRMLFLTSTIYLHRPPATRSILNVSADSNSVYASTKILRSAATEIAVVARHLHALNLTGYYPTTGVTMLLSALVCHLQVTQCNNDKSRMGGDCDFRDCMRSLHYLRGVYVTADFAATFLDMAIKRHKIGQILPEQGTKPAQAPRHACGSDPSDTMPCESQAGSTLNTTCWTEIDGKGQDDQNSKNFLHVSETGSVCRQDSVLIPNHELDNYSLHEDFLALINWDHTRCFDVDGC